MSDTPWSCICEVCGHHHALDSGAWRCQACGGALALDGPNELKPLSIDRDEPTLWRYQDVLPVDRGDVHSLGEGMTPLVPGTLAGRSAWFKLDALLPTGSFKDRGAVVLIAHLRRLGVRRLIVDSSGNAAAAFAGYCVANGLECIVFAPATTSPGKLVQARAYGATVHLVHGNREAVATAAQDAAAIDSTAFYASHNWHPVFVEGVKTWAIEVWEQLGGKLPAAAFIPTGGGSAFVGARRGFEALQHGLPVLVAAQPAACAPVANAMELGGHDIAAMTPGQTIAEGTRIGAPARGRQILGAIRDSDGWAEAVQEQDIEGALRELWGQGLYVEPTAAVGAAAFRAAVQRGHDLPDGDIVVLLTGSGLKATETISRIV